MSKTVIEMAREALKVARDQIVDPEYAPIGWSVSRFDEVLKALADQPAQQEGNWIGTVVDSGYGYKVIGFAVDTLADIPVGTRCYTTPQAQPAREPLIYCPECMRPNPVDGTACAHGIKEKNHD